MTFLLAIAMVLGLGLSAHAKQQTVMGTIKEFVCGDNCYLTIVADRDGRPKDITGLCVAKECRAWNSKTEMPASNVGRKVIVTLTVGVKLTDGDKFDEFAVAFSKIKFVTPVATTQQTVTCEGTLEHGSGGDYVGMEPQCWFGSHPDVEASVSAVCKQSEPCKVVGIATRCAKNDDPHMCLEIIELTSVSKTSTGNRQGDRRNR